MSRMVSYAQNREDVLLARVFPADRPGFYVDVGAYDPTSCSITRHFYNHGWHGVNVEPAPAAAERIRAARPRDNTVNLALSNREGTLTFFEAEPKHAGLSTLDRAQAEVHRRRGVTMNEYDVPVITLAKLCEMHCPAAIDFISVDVEGHERQVLEGMDFTRFRPTVMVVEATRPMATEQTHGQWESILLNAGYRYATFDGLNRYYVDAPRADEFIPKLAVPPNVFDDFIPYEYSSRIEELEREVKALRALVGAGRYVASALNQGHKAATDMALALRDRLQGRRED